MTDLTPRVFVFVPTYNDSIRLADLCRSVLELPGDNFSVFVVDDGSTPPIDRSLLPSQAMLVRLSENYGLGLATHVAIDHMLANDYDVFVRVDGDGQHPVQQIPELVSKVVDGGFDLVIGERLYTGRDRNIRGVAVRLVHRYYRFVGGLMTGGRSLGDPTSGFQVLNRRAALKLKELPLERYPEPEIAFFAVIDGLRVGEVPVEPRARAEGVSTISLQRGLLLLFRFNVFALTHFLDKIAPR